MIYFLLGLSFTINVIYTIVLFFVFRYKKKFNNFFNLDLTDLGSKSNDVDIYDSDAFKDFFGK